MDIIKTKDSRYTEYENLLIRRDSLRKDSEHYYLKYLSLFGDLINEVFAKKIECIAKKKRIAYCQARANRNETISSADLDAYIDSVMADYYQELDDMIKMAAAARESNSITLFEAKKIKDIYRYLAKLIHPDRRPDLADDETVRDLWRLISAAYTCNNLNELQELQYRTEMYLNGLGNDNIDVEIPDIEEKIRMTEAEIEKILTTLPYQYRFIIDDENEIRTRRQELQNELKSYTEYSAQLDEVLKQFDIVRVMS